MNDKVVNPFQLLSAFRAAKEKVVQTPPDELILLSEWFELSTDIVSAIMTWVPAMHCGIDWGRGLTLHICDYDSERHEHTYYKSVHLMDETFLEEDAVEYQRTAFKEFINKFIKYLD